MIRSVFHKTLYDKRWFMLGWTLGLAALAALLASFYPAMRQDGMLDELVQNMPPAFEGLIGNLANLREFTPYMASQLFDIRLPLIAGIMAIILGLSLSTAEEESGELRTLMALPISRTKLLVQKWLAMVVITGVTVVGIAIGTYAVLPFLDDASLEPEAMLRLLGMSWLLMVTFGTVPFAAGMALGRRAPAMALAVGLVLGSFVLTTFGQAVDWLESYEWLSLLHYFPAVDIAQDGIGWPDATILAAITGVLLLCAVLVFRRRDIN